MDKNKQATIKLMEMRQEDRVSLLVRVYGTEHPAAFLSGFVQPSCLFRVTAMSAASLLRERACNPRSRRSHQNLTKVAFQSSVCCLPRSFSPLWHRLLRRPYLHYLYASSKRETQYGSEPRDATAAMSSEEERSRKGKERSRSGGASRKGGSQKEKEEAKRSRRQLSGSVGKGLQPEIARSAKTVSALPKPKRS